MSEEAATPSRLAGRVLEEIKGLGLAAPSSAAVGWDRAVRESVIADLDAAVRELTVYRGEVLLAHREEGSWGSALDRDFADWRGRTSGAGRGSAVGELQVAEGLEAMPEVATAVAEGELTLEHAKALARLRATGSAQVQEALSNGAAADLVARGKGMSAPELAKAAKKVAAAIDAQAAQDSFAAVWRRRSLTSRKSAGGRAGEWFLDDVGGTIVDTALDAIVGTPAKEDMRSREQRRADALVMMASRVLQVGNDLTGAQVRPHLALLVEDRTWAAVRQWRQQIETGTDAGNGPSTSVVDGSVGRASGEFAGGPGGLAGGGPVAGAAFRPPGGDASALTRVGCTFVDGRPGRRAAIPPLPSVPPAELEDGSIIPLVELERLMCDCETTRLVMDAHGLPMDVGQTQRTYVKELRRAVTTRDRACQWPGCSIRASWCEVHHLWWYSKGGPTTVGHGMTVCSFHHHRIHDEHIDVTVLADGFDFHRRDGRHLGTTRRTPRTTGRRPGLGEQQAPEGRAPSDGYAPSQRQALPDGYAPPGGYAPSQRHALPDGYAPPGGYAPSQRHAPPDGYAPSRVLPGGPHEALLRSWPPQEAQRPSRGSRSPTGDGRALGVGEVGGVGSPDRGVSPPGRPPDDDPAAESAGRDRRRSIPATDVGSPALWEPDSWARGSLSDQPHDPPF